MEKLMDIATSDDDFGCPTKTLQEIAEASFNHEDFIILFKILWERLSSKSKKWRRIYKTLKIIEYLIRNGSEECIIEIIKEIFQLRTLQDFTHYEKNEDKGIFLRERVKNIIEMLSSKKKIKEIRNMNNKLKDNIIGIGNHNDINNLNYEKKQFYTPKNEKNLENFDNFVDFNSYNNWNKSENSKKNLQKSTPENKNHENKIDFFEQWNNIPIETANNNFKDNYQNDTKSKDWKINIEFPKSEEKVKNPDKMFFDQNKNEENWYNYKEFTKFNENNKQNKNENSLKEKNNNNSNQNIIEESFLIQPPIHVHSHKSIEKLNSDSIHYSMYFQPFDNNSSDKKNIINQSNLLEFSDNLSNDKNNNINNNLKDIQFDCVQEFNLLDQNNTQQNNQNFNEFKDINFNLLNSFQIELLNQKKNKE